MEPRVIATEGEARSVVAVLKDEAHIGIDCEGLNLGTNNGEVTLIQITTGGPCPVVYLFDVQERPGIAPILKPILESEDIVKIIHDCRSDRTNLLKDFDIRLGPVFDTQIAYKYIYPNSSGRRDFRIGWNDLCTFYHAPTNPLKDKFHNIYKTNPAIWKMRPLTREMLIYASADVGNLISFYKKMKKKIAQMGQRDRSRFAKECRTAKRGKLTKSAAPL